MNGLIEASILYLSIAGGTYILGAIITRVLLSRERAKAGAVHERLARYHALAHRLDERRRELTVEVVRQDERTKAARRHQFIAAKCESDLREGANDVRRVLGEDMASGAEGRRHPIKFRAVLSNREAQRAHTKNKLPDFLSPAWAHAQTCDVWAYNDADAKKLLERHFPAALGFFILGIGEVVELQPGKPPEALQQVKSSHG